MTNQYKIRYGGAMISNEEVNAIVKTINKNRELWQAGSEAKLMEQEAASFLGVKHAILTASGSCAGLLALSALELPKGSEVIICAVTFPTIFNIILQCGLVPVVVDANVGTYGFDIADVQSAITPKTRAIIAIHPLGNPVDMPALMKVVKSYKQKIYVIEDNCDGWGSRIGDRLVGSFGDISITSFHAAHIVSMGIGGGVFTNNKDIATKVRIYRDWGRQADINHSVNKKWKQLPKDYNPRFIYEKIGYNFQILEIQAAMGRIQLRKADRIKRLRKKNFDFLVKHLGKHKELLMPATVKNADVCWFSLPLSVNKDRGKLLHYLEKHGIETRPMFAGDITKHPAYKNSVYRKHGTLRGANYILKHSFWIAVHPRYSTKDLQYVVDVFNAYFKD